MLLALPASLGLWCSAALCAPQPSLGEELTALHPIPKVVLSGSSCWRSALIPDLNHRLDLLETHLSGPATPSNRYFAGGVCHPRSDPWDVSREGRCFTVASMPDVDPRHLTYMVNRLDDSLLAAFRLKSERGGLARRLSLTEQGRLAAQRDFGVATFMYLKTLEDVKGRKARPFNYDLLATGVASVEIIVGSASRYERWTCAGRRARFQKVLEFDAPSASAFRAVRSNGMLFLLLPGEGVYRVPAASPDTMKMATASRVSPVSPQALIVDKDTARAYVYANGSLWELAKEPNKIPVPRSARLGAGKRVADEDLLPLARVVYGLRQRHD